ncbi:MAG: alpha/beta fold hydrolase [bacterium]
MNALYPFKPHYLTIDNNKYHYVDEGHGEPILMIHGNPTWSFYYRELIKAFSDRYRMIAPDHIGCGRSDKPDDHHYDYTLAQRLSDLDYFISHMGLERITLVVHDWGGMIGIAWATQHPEKISRLVVFNTAAFPKPDAKRFPATLMLARSPWLGSFFVRGVNAFVRGANHFCVSRRPLSPEIASGYLEPYKSWADRIAIHRFVQDIPLRSQDRSFEILSRTAGMLTCLADKPMLICWGMRDFVFDHNFLDEWMTRFPNVDVHRFKDCGHYILEDAGDEVISLMERFLLAHPLEVC